MPASTFLPTFSVCICTRDNPDGLRQTLQSVFESTMPPHEILVSDDSSNYNTRQMMRESYAAIPYLEGPRRTPAANRNRLVRAATGSHVLFLDDMTLLGETFLQQMAERIADDFIRRAQVGEMVAPLILTGVEACQGRCIKPRKCAYLGYPSLEYRSGERLQSVILASTVFPRRLFDSTCFHEHLADGYDIIDLANRSVHEHGHRIELMPSAVNRASRVDTACATHDSPDDDASRIYTAFRSYRRGKHQPFRAALFVLIALPHNLWRNCRGTGRAGLPAFAATTQKFLLLLNAESVESPDRQGGTPGLPRSAA
ncbi:hypothetical protein LMG23992_03464 [Cupriavidus laharis]|uniref:Glycosyltransferase 2-like domain-containing protein n=1 Tax=Cupriavidus laharis TaxID=151654 RepID=A0ABM8XBB9_9BURK|nr:glycosyltransferase family 2 protein [Cupriavidus laharis]CAG9177296.1 hypothetical protein LMG23992_03464 [Cupriavidus laharis]